MEDHLHHWQQRQQELILSDYGVDGENGGGCVEATEARIFESEAMDLVPGLLMTKVQRGRVSAGLKVSAGMDVADMVLVPVSCGEIALVLMHAPLETTAAREAIGVAMTSANLGVMTDLGTVMCGTENVGANATSPTEGKEVLDLAHGTRFGLPHQLSHLHPRSPNHPPC